MKNVFACLVHEKPDVIRDMVCNLRYLDPPSHILLYNNSGDASFLEDHRFLGDSHILIYPEPKRQPLHTLHGYMIDCMRWVCDKADFDTITNVDSDQLLLRPGYTERLGQIMTQHPNMGMLRSSSVTLGWPSDGNSSVIPLGFTSEAAVINYPQLTALDELKAWAPFLKKFANDSGYRFSGLSHFPRWSFWPATVFRRRGAKAILHLLDSNIYLRALIGRSQIFATEEIIFPTLVSLLGLDLVQTPFDETCLRFRTEYSVDILKESLHLPNRFWMHPVPRDMNDPLRTRLREHHRQYQQD